MKSSLKTRCTCNSSLLGKTWTCDVSRSCCCIHGPYVAWFKINGWTHIISQSVVLIHGSIKYNYLSTTGQCRAAQLRLIIDPSTAPQCPVVPSCFSETLNWPANDWTSGNITIFFKYRDISKNSISFSTIRYDTIYWYRKRYIDISIYRVITTCHYVHYRTETESRPIQSRPILFTFLVQRKWKRDKLMTSYY